MNIFKNKIFILGIVIRLVLIFYGEYQDSYSAVKYTDIDYKVYTVISSFYKLEYNLFNIFL